MLLVKTRCTPAGAITSCPRFVLTRKKVWPSQASGGWTSWSSRDGSETAGLDGCAKSAARSARFGNDYVLLGFRKI